MARELSRLAQGFFPTQPRIVAAIAKLIQPAADGNVTVLDAGCGTGAAIRALKDAWNKPVNVKLFGIESDKDRADAAEKVLDEVLWSNIEDASPSAGVSLLFFNPPYDQVRGQGRLELELFKRVKDWPVRKTGLLVLIVPKSIITEDYSSLAMELEKHYDVQPFNYPEPEAQEFGQCVLIGTRRVKDEKVWNTPAWAGMDWPTLPLNSKHPQFTAKPSAGVTLRRIELSDEVIVDALSRSPLKHTLLHEALAPEPPLARPPLPLRSGHIALMLAGGLCDTMVDDPTHGKFMVKGTLNVGQRKIRTDEKLDSNGEVCAMVDVYRTRYELAVKALRADGTVEAYTSEEPTNEENKDE
jgi:SAM-dependent methyltransferase